MVTIGYMLDTDSSSYLIKKSNVHVIERLRQVPVHAVCISVITKSELLYGVEISPRRSKNEAEVALYLRSMAVLDFPSEAAADYAVIRAELKRRGTPIGSNDTWIAAHARHLGLTLVTNNVREFSRVPGLKMENWAEPSSSALSSVIR